MLTTLLLTVAVSAATPQESCQLEADKVFVHEVVQVTNGKPTMLTRVGTCDKGDPINIVEKEVVVYRLPPQKPLVPKTGGDYEYAAVLEINQ